MPSKDEYYFILEKRLNNHINAKNNPHKITKGDLGLDQVENRPFKKEWIFEDGEPDSYISSLLVKAKLEEVTKDLKGIIKYNEETTELVLDKVTKDVNKALKNLGVVDELLDFIYLHNNPLIINFDNNNSFITPTPKDGEWNLIKKYLKSDHSNYLTVIVNGKFYHAYCEYDFDETDGKEYLTLKSNMSGEITININSETQEYDLDLVKWYGLEEERNIALSDPLDDIPWVLEDSFIFPSWLGKDFTKRQKRLQNIQSQIINVIINNKFFKAKITETEIKGRTIKISLLTSEGKLVLNYTPDSEDFNDANWNLDSINRY